MHNTIYCMSNGLHLHLRKSSGTRNSFRTYSYNVQLQCYASYFPKKYKTRNYIFYKTTAVFVQFSEKNTNDLGIIVACNLSPKAHINLVLLSVHKKCNHMLWRLRAILTEHRRMSSQNRLWPEQTKSVVSGDWNFGRFIFLVLTFCSKYLIFSAVKICPLWGARTINITGRQH